MITVQESIDIEADIESVFAVVTDPRRGSQWNPNVIDVTNFSGYPVGLGSMWRQVTVVLGRPMNLDCRIVRWEPPHLGVLVISGDQRGEIVTCCDQADSKTRLTQIVSFELPGGFLGRMAGGLARPQMQREVRQALERQRAALEEIAGESGGPAPT